MKRIMIAMAFALGAAVSAHADTSTYYWQGKGGLADEQLQAAARLCDQRHGVVARSPRRITSGACSSKAGNTEIRLA